MATWRQTIIERDYSGITNTLVDETGAMVVKSRKGKSTPMYLQSEQDVLRELGNPSAEYPEVFEAIAFTRSAPLWCVSAIGDGALYGGIDVKLNTVTGFGVGRDYTTFNNYTAVPVADTHTVGTGDGLTATYTGSITNVPIINHGNFVVTVNGTTKTVSMDNAGALTGADVTAGSVNLTNGSYTITFSGVVGTPAEVTTDVDGSSNFDLSSGATDKLIKITIDGVTQTVNLGQSATTSLSDVVGDINTAFSDTVAAVDGNFITITGSRGSSTSGSITVTDPDAGDSALILVFSTSGDDLTDSGTNPTGAVPQYGQAVVFAYNYADDLSADISHSFFTTSPYVDDLAASVQYVSGSKFRLTLYKRESKGNSVLAQYDYSLIRENDGFGRSLYYADVFDEDPYVIFKINTAFTGTAFVLPGTAVVNFSGGVRGADPDTADYTAAWNNFQKANKYKAKIFMDVNGNSASTINTLIQTYQNWGQGISVIPIGNTAAEGLTYRSTLALDTDDVCLYHNYIKIRDDYNGSFAWISGAGSIGRRYALCNTSYDAASPAGINEVNYGGQISDWTVIDVENYFTDAEMRSYYNAQINPIVLDEAYGLMIYGDQTLQVTGSDTSYVGTRRLYKYIIDVVSNQILRKQEFKLNDERHRLQARVQTENFVGPIAADGWIREYLVVCDDTNNTDIVLNNRQFILDIYIKITPNSQFVTLRLTRLSQTQVIAEVIG